MLKNPIFDWLGTGSEASCSDGSNVKPGVLLSGQAAAPHHNAVAGSCRAQIHRVADGARPSQA